VTRFGPGATALKIDLDASSSVVVSTSLNNDDRNEGWSFVSMCERDGLPGRLFAGRIEFDVAGTAEDDPAVSKTLRVRGRFSFRSGSLDDSAGSLGEAVADFDFLFRLFGLAVSISFAFSNAPQALTSSGVSTGVCGL